MISSLVSTVLAMPHLLADFYFITTYQPITYHNGWRTADVTSFSGLQRCFKRSFGRPTESHRQLLGISANSPEIGFIRSRGSSVVMISCSKWNLIVIWSLLCLCAWTEASYYEMVSTNPSYLTINIFQRKEDARKFLLPLGRDRSAIWRHFLTSCFFYNSQGKVNHRSAEEKQGKVIQIRPSLKFYSPHKSSDRIQFSPRYTTT